MLMQFAVIYISKVFPYLDILIVICSDRHYSVQLTISIRWVDDTIELIATL